MEVCGEANISVASGNKVGAIRSPFRGVSELMCNHGSIHTFDSISGHDVGIEVSQDQRVVWPYFLHVAK